MDFNMGQKVKQLRKLKGLSILQLSEISGVSTGLISQIERDLVVPTVVSIWRIAKALDTNIGFFFEDIEKNGGRESLSGLGLGYRDEYIWGIFSYQKQSPGFIEELLKLDYEASMKYLMGFKGIGKKVANCICLFGLHHLDACPVDVWMKKVIDEEYGGVMPAWMTDPYAGVYQQYTFFYKREKK